VYFSNLDHSDRDRRSITNWSWRT